MTDTQRATLEKKPATVARQFLGIGQISGFLFERFKEVADSMKSVFAAVDAIFLIEDLSRPLAQITKPLEVPMHSLHDQHQRKKRDKIRKISIKSSGMTRFRRPAPSPGVSHWGKDQDPLGAGVPRNRSCYASSPETHFART